ncbi:MAG: hypothetical protein WCK37_00245 [Candidatus Falkowbacteria bacterium]
MTLNLKMSETTYLINFLSERKKHLDEMKFIDGLGAYEIRELKMINEVIEKLKKMGYYIIIFKE